MSAISKMMLRTPSHCADRSGGNRCHSKEKSPLWVATLLMLMFATLLQTTAQAAARGTILVYGDSLSAAYGISQKDGSVVIRASRKPITIRSYGARQTKKKGVVVKVLKSGGRKTIRDKLVSRMRLVA